MGWYDGAGAAVELRSKARDGTSFGLLLPLVKRQSDEVLGAKCRHIPLMPAPDQVPQKTRAIATREAPARSSHRIVVGMPIAFIGGDEGRHPTQMEVQQPFELRLAGVDMAVGQVEIAWRNAPLASCRRAKASSRRRMARRLGCPGCDPSPPVTITTRAP